MTMIKMYIVTAVMLLHATSCLSADMEITPFRTNNQRPLVQIFGLPVETSATITPPGRVTVGISQDIASEFIVSETAHERLTLDGESYRWVLSARYGINQRFEAGIDIPYVLYGGGFFDGFIVDWHKTFNLPQNGRDLSPKNRMTYRYSKDGLLKLDMRQAGSGLGDISFAGGVKLYNEAHAVSHDSLTLRAALKLPSGESSSLRGSGSTDFSLYLCGSMNNFTEWGSLGVFGSAGGMVMSRGDVLPDQQNNVAGFGTVGLGWGAAEWISFKLQLNAHTAFFNGSALAELSNASVMLVGGGALKLPDGYLLDIGVSEDISVGTAPDVALHLALSKQF
jgi:hypothetical protein